MQAVSMSVRQSPQRTNTPSGKCPHFGFAFAPALSLHRVAYEKHKILQQ